MNKKGLEEYKNKRGDRNTHTHTCNKNEKFKKHKKISQNKKSGMMITRLK